MSSAISRKVLTEELDKSISNIAEARSKIESLSYNIGLVEHKVAKITDDLYYDHSSRSSVVKKLNLEYADIQKFVDNIYNSYESLQLALIKFSDTIDLIKKHK